MLAKIPKSLSEIPGWLRVLVCVSAMLMLCGATCNMLIMWANNGKMPLAIQKGDVLFVIGPAQFGVNYFPTVDTIKKYYPQYQPLTENTKFRILADRIPISFRLMKPNVLPTWCYKVLELYKIQAGEDTIASIGDLLLWPGIVLAFPTTLLLFARLLSRIFLRVRGKV